MTTSQATDPSTVENSADTPAEPRPPLGQRIASVIENRFRFVPVVCVLLAVSAVFAFASPVFLTSRNLTNLTLQVVVIAILALGMLQVLIVGEIDLALGAASAICAAVFAQLAVLNGTSVPVAVLAAIATGAVIGLIQGFVVTVFSVPSFIITLGVAFALQGAILLMLPPATLQISLQQLPFAEVATSYVGAQLSFAILGVALVLLLVSRRHTHRSNRRHGLRSNPAYTVFAPVIAVGIVGIVGIVVLDDYKGVPVLLLVTLALYAICAFVLSSTRFGVSMYAVGGNVEAAARSGINVKRVRVITFIIANALGAIAGIFAAVRVLSVSASSGSTDLVLSAVAACIIGGVSLFGGRGNPWAALLGAFVIGTVNNGLFLITAPEAYRLLAEGGILVAAILFDRLISRAGGLK